MEPQAALVGADGAVELNPESAIDMEVVVVVVPRDPELYYALGLDHATYYFDVARIGLDYRAQTVKNLLYCLMEFRLIGVPC